MSQRWKSPYFATHAGKRFSKAKNLEKYGLSLKEYDRLVKKADGHCGCCGIKVEGTLSVDHNHTTGKVRGLVCSSCNSTIGMAKEDVNRLYACIEYLKEHGSVHD